MTGSNPVDGGSIPSTPAHETLNKMNQQEIKDLLTDFGYEGTVLFESPSYDTACVGVTEDGRAVYNYDKMVQHLVNEDKMTEEEAIEFIDYNTIRSLPYQVNAPIVVTFFEDMA